MDTRLSVIVPLAPAETEWRGLLRQLQALPSGCEVILVTADGKLRVPPRTWPAEVPLRHCDARIGRAHQMNAGARAARGRWLWFLHADSRLPPEALETLFAFLAEEIEALTYFRLAFRQGGPRHLNLNALGANWRSRWLGLPFGDQGFLIPAHRFAELGGYDEDAAYGEDHRLVWSARHAGLPLVCLDARVLTSPRKYIEHGWWTVTRLHLRLTVTQAVSEWRRLRRGVRA